MARYLVDLYAEGIQVTATSLEEAEALALSDLIELASQWNWTDYEVEPTDQPPNPYLVAKYDVVFDVTVAPNPDEDSLYTFMGKRTANVVAGSEQGALFAALQQLGKSRLDRKPPTQAAPAKPKRPPEEEASESRQQQARLLFDARNWNDLWRFKRTCKKTWRQLGFSFNEEENIIKVYKPNWI